MFPMWLILPCRMNPKITCIGSGAPGGPGRKGSPSVLHARMMHSGWHPLKPCWGSLFNVNNRRNPCSLFYLNLYVDLRNQSRQHAAVTAVINRAVTVHAADRGGAGNSASPMNAAWSNGGYAIDSTAQAKCDLLVQ